MSAERLTESKCPHQEFTNDRCVACGGKRRIDLAGQTFHHLTVLEMLPESKVRCRCVCGKIRVTTGSKIRLGRVRSCGCLTGPGSHTKHGHCRVRGRTLSHQSWSAMIARCQPTNAGRYPGYSPRGIRVCERWAGKDGFANFLADMGERPSKAHSIDRFPNNDGDYEPGNCRWATQKQQSRNSRQNRILTYNGVSKCLAQWAEDAGLPVWVVRYRLKQGWPMDQVLETPA